MNFNDFKSDLKHYPPDKIVFVGLGNQLRQDDAAGLLFTDKLAEKNIFKDAHFIKAYTTPESHMEEILRYHPKMVVIIDAANWGGEPGALSWVNSVDIEDLAISTHSYSISLIEKYLKLNCSLEVKYLVIQPESMLYNKPVTEKVNEKIDHFLTT